MRVFLSHSAKDLALASAINELITRGVGLSDQSVFFSSSVSHGIPVGETFRNFIKLRLQECDIVLAVVTHDYHESEFCMQELGAAWALDKRVLPLLGPTMLAADLGSTMKDLQAVRLDQEESWDLIREAFPDSKSSASIWTAAKNHFRAVISTFSTAHSNSRSAPEQRSFARSEGPDCQAALEGAIRKARRIVMMGSGLNILKNRPLVEDLIGRAKRRECEVEIYLADRNSPDVEARLIEEQILEKHHGPAGIQALHIYHDLKTAGIDTAVQLRIFTHYPTFALIIADDDYFTYPYGYATIGNLSPVSRYSRKLAGDLPFITFFDRQHKLIQRAAVDANVAFSLLDKHSDVKTDTFETFAVYYIPSEDTEFYRFGSQILGFDVRRGLPVGQSNDPARRILSPMQVGRAVEFGFHLTVCDALFFSNETELSRAVAETYAMARQFRPFPLGHMRVTQKSPDRHSVAIITEDHTGCIEAMHCEFVHRLYRRAIASNYSLGRTPLNADDSYDRAQLMVARYKAPHILKRFTPHFTLGCNVDPVDQQTLCRSLNEAMKRTIPSLSTTVDHLCVMKKTGLYWSISKEIPLGR